MFSSRTLLWLFFVASTIAVAQEPASDKKSTLKLKPKNFQTMTQKDLMEYKAQIEKRAAELGIQHNGPKYIPLTASEQAKLKPLPKRIPGTTIQYDSGIVTGFHTAVASSRAVGNRFDSAIGDSGTMCCFPVENSGTITMVTFHKLRTSNMEAIFSLYSNIMGTTANKVTSMTFPAAVGLNTVTLGTMTNGQYQNGTFIAAFFQFNTMFTRVGADTNTNGGQGFKGLTLNDNTVMGGGNTGTAIMNVPNLNFVIRVGGNVATPVELMNFKVE